MIVYGCIHISLKINKLTERGHKTNDLKYITKKKKNTINYQKKREKPLMHIWHASSYFLTKFLFYTANCLAKTRNYIFFAFYYIYKLTYAPNLSKLKAPLIAFAI